MDWRRRRYRRCILVSASGCAHGVGCGAFFEPFGVEPVSAAFDRGSCLRILYCLPDDRVATLAVAAVEHGGQPVHRRTFTPDRLAFKDALRPYALAFGIDARNYQIYAVNYPVLKRVKRIRMGHYSFAHRLCRAGSRYRGELEYARNIRRSNTDECDKWKNAVRRNQNKKQ